MKCLILGVCCVLSGCSGDQVQPSPGASPVATAVQQVNKDRNDQQDPMISSLQTAINDDIWYKGRSSHFKSLEQQTVPIEIYKKSEDEQYPYVLVLSNAGQSPNDTFIAIGMWSGFHGYSNTLTNFMFENSVDKLRTKLKETGYTLTQTSNLQIPQVAQPSYPPISSFKQKILDDIESTMKQNLNNHLFPAGSYHIYIRNFRDNDYQTKVVLEDSSGQSWIQEFRIQENGHAAQGKIYPLSEYKGLGFESSQDKKVSIVDKVITTEEQTTPTPQPDTRESTIYKNEKMGFTLNLPVSWKNKYEIKDTKSGISVLYIPRTPNLEKVVLFTIDDLGSEEEWNKWWEAGGKDTGVPYKKIGVLNKHVIVRGGPTEAIYQGQEDIKTDAMEYDKMLKDITFIEQSFSPLNTTGE